MEQSPPSTPTSDTSNRILSGVGNTLFGSSTRRAAVLSAVAFGGIKIARWLTGNADLSDIEIGAIVGATIAVGNKILQGVTPRFGESRSQMIGRWLLKIPQIRAMLEEKKAEEYRKFCAKTIEQWAQFGDPITVIPDEGMTQEQLLDLVDSYARKTNEPLEDLNISGTVYQPSLLGEAVLGDIPQADTSQGTALDRTMAVLRKVLPETFNVANLWNSLHGDEFPIGNFVEYQVVRMVGEMFGAQADEVSGFVTSGGTESLMQAAYCYRQWGREKRGHGLGESVIIVPDTIHAALDKAAKKYDIKLVKVPADEHGVVDINALREAVREHGDKVCAIFGSAPSYPTGKVDQIREMAAIALENGCGFHVDSCLGGFIVNFLDDIYTDFFKIPGVTSLSADTHKNGYAPKGSSVFCCKNGTGHDLTQLAAFCVAASRIGVYGTPRDPGSHPIIPALFAFLTLLAVGKNTYRSVAKQIQRTTRALAAGIRRFRNEVRVLGDANANVVAFQIDPALGLEKGATYALAHEMKNRGFVVNSIKGDAIHICVTSRLAQKKNLVREFKGILGDSLAAVKELDVRVKAGEIAFPGDAPLYCTVEGMSRPNLQEQGIAKFVENMFLGEIGLTKIVELFFQAKQNPFLFERLAAQTA